MSKRDKIYNKVNEFKDGEIPIDDKNFITKYFGARIIGSMDTNLIDAFSQLDNLNGQSKLNEEQKIAVKEILKNNTKNFLYSMLLKFRDFTYPVEVNFLNPNKETPEKLVGLEDEIEFHFHYFDWIEEFSDLIDEP